MNIFFEGILLAAGLGFFIYGRRVKIGGNTTGFYRIWYLLGLIAIGFGYALERGLFDHLSGWLKVLFLVLVSAGIVIFLLVEGLILTGFHRPAPGELPCIIVLGAHVREDGPCRALGYRLDTAEAYMKQYPKTICIVSGGQGADEPFSEASCMKAYMEKRGVDPGRIILEDRSRTTRENILYSCKIMGDRGIKGRTGLVTNDFHMYRAEKIARANGLSEPVAISAGSTLFFLPHNLLREFFGMIKYYIELFRKDRS